ncbi:MAG: SMC family ATPase [Myxococcota bacterium]|nr:SMC family ATPase [Myxococcota bacterium]
MKILQIEMENLASMRGKHRIDLQQIFSQCGVLLIHGPTGSGKTTILDAISLALFGRTARLGTQSEQHIMTLGTGRCRATVLVELHPEGKKEYYAFTWEVHRARNHATGNLATPTYLINQLSAPNLDAEVIHSLYNSVKVKDWRQLVQSLLGNLSYADFARSCFLFQNEYSRFLRSKSTEKAALLAALTHTEYFYQIGEHISKSQLQLKSQYDKLKKQTEFLLTEDKKEKIKEQLDKQHQNLLQTDQTLEILQPKKNITKELYTVAESYHSHLLQWYKQIEGTISPQEIEQLEFDRKIRPFENLFQEYLQRKEQLQVAKLVRKNPTPTHQKQQELRAKYQLQEIKKEGLEAKRQLLGNWRQILRKLTPSLEQYKNAKLQASASEKKRKEIQKQIQRLSDRKKENQALIEYTKQAPHLFLAAQQNPPKGIRELKRQLRASKMKNLPDSLEGLLHLHSDLVQTLISNIAQSGANEERLQRLTVEKEQVEKKQILLRTEIVALQDRIQNHRTSQALIEEELDLSLTERNVERHYNKTVQQCEELKQSIKANRALAEDYGSFLQLYHNLRANLSSLQLTISDINRHLLPQHTRKELEHKYTKAQDPMLQTKLAQHRRVFEEKLRFYQIKMRVDDLSSVQGFVEKQHRKLQKEELRYNKLLQKRTLAAQKIKEYEKQLHLHESVPKHLKSKIRNLEIQRAHNKTLHQMLGMRGAGRNAHVLFEEKAQAYNLRRFIDLSNKHILGITNQRYQLEPQIQNGVPSANFCIYDSMLKGQRELPNFSGGENFQLSLGLALGIGELQDSTEPMESLFIDEGFGTLDQESLQTVIETLNQLGQKLKKQIVIISHVAQLPEDFDVRIAVKKGEDGFSVLTVHGLAP